MATDIIARGMAGNAKKLLDEYKNNPDVADIVQSKAALDTYDTSKLSESDIVKVLDDESRNHMETYYKWTNNTWNYIGGLGPYYNQDEINGLLDLKADNSYIKDGMLHEYKGTSSINLYSGLEKITIPCIVEDIYSPVPSDASYNSSTTYYIKASDFEIQTDKEYITFEEAAGEPMNAEHFADYKDYLYTYTSNVTYVHPTVYDPDETYYRYSSGKYVPYPGTITPQIFDRVKDMLWIIVYTTITFPTKTGTVALTSDFNDFNTDADINLNSGGTHFNIPHTTLEYVVAEIFDPDAIYYIDNGDGTYSPVSDFGIVITAENFSDYQGALWIPKLYKVKLPLGKSGIVALISDIPSGLVEKTYSELKAMRDGGTLVAGTQYRITDYTCTTTTTNTSSAGHQFDIIVIADSSNKLNENARACLHNGDTYFINCKLEAWQLKYCIDNDYNRFGWANTVGIEIGGSVYYRYSRNDGTGDYPYAWYNNSNTRYTNTETPTTDTKAYGSRTGGTSYTISSIHEEVGKGVIYFMKDEFNNEIFYDFKNILSDNKYTFGGTSDGSINTTYGIVNNKIISAETRLSLPYIYIKNYSKNNLIINSTGITVDGNSNTIINSNSVIFRGNCSCNTLRSCNNIDLGTGCHYNTFNDGCQYIFLTGYWRYNKFGKNVRYINYTYAGNNMEYFQYITIDDGCQYIDLVNSQQGSSSNYLQNIHIHSGVKGTSTSSPLTITVLDRNSDYSIDYYATNSMEVYL